MGCVTFSDLFECFVISCCFACTINPCLRLLREEFYSCFFVQFLFVLYVSICVVFPVFLDGVRG
jgi:hypothetical protein